MLMSTDRILVSHVGSLPRPATLSELLIRQEAGETIDAAELARQVEIATAHVIGKQVEAGVDVGNDGEQSRVGFQTYVPRCLCGFGGESRRPPSRDQTRLPKLCPADGNAFSALRARVERAGGAVRCPVCKQRPDQRGRREAQANGEPLQRMFHDGAVTGHRRDDDAQSALR